MAAALNVADASPSAADIITSQDLLTTCSTTGAPYSDQCFYFFDGALQAYALSDKTFAACIPSTYSDLAILSLVLAYIRSDPQIGVFPAAFAVRQAVDAFPCH